VLDGWIGGEEELVGFEALTLTGAVCGITLLARGGLLQWP